MSGRKPSTDAAVIKAAIAMMRAGLATQAEIAELAGTSRQLVRHWATKSEIDATAMRSKYLAREWQKRIAKAPQNSQ
jgi:predicted NUDIX family NTP pyrophosphohydrolase